MVDIQEIPLDIEETHENDADTEENNQEIIDIPAPKKKGRPAGAKNKAKAPVVKAPVLEPVIATKAQVKKVKPVEPKKRKRVVVSSSSESEEEIAPVIDRHALAADMLQILSQQRHTKATAKRAHYATWFQ